MTLPESLGKRHRLGTRVQYRTGYIYVKTPDGMMPEARRIWEMKRGPLAPGDRVFHLDGDRTNNNLINLAKVHFNAKKFVMLKASRVLWMRSLRTIDKKTGKILINS